MCEEWCRMKLANLKIEEHRSNTLVEIRDHIDKLPEDEAVVTSTYTVPAIFNYVEDFHDKYVTINFNFFYINFVLF